MFSHSCILKGAFEASGKILKGLFGMALREDKSFSCEECLQSALKLREIPWATTQVIQVEIGR
jgi:hypothetical protein